MVWVEVWFGEHAKLACCFKSPAKMREKRKNCREINDGSAQKMCPTRKKSLPKAPLDYNGEGGEGKKGQKKLVLKSKGVKMGKKSTWKRF